MLTSMFQIALIDVRSLAERGKRRVGEKACGWLVRTTVDRQYIFFFFFFDGDARHKYALQGARRPEARAWACRKAARRGTS